MPPVASSLAKRIKLYAAWEDTALVAALAQDDELAFAEVYERYWLQLYQVAHRKLGSREAAEEVVQDVFTGLWYKRRTHQAQHLKSYLLTAVKYRVIDSVKARLTHSGYLEKSRPQQTPADYSTEETVAVDDLSLALLASLEQLPEHTREVFRLSRFEHHSVAEIAARLNISPKTVEYHLTRALKLLRVNLGDFLVVAIICLRSFQ